MTPLTLAVDRMYDGWVVAFMNDQQERCDVIFGDVARPIIFPTEEDAKEAILQAQIATDILEFIL